MSQQRLCIDLLDPALYASDPHEVWSWMRDNEPVYRDSRNGLWAITRHAHVREVERRSAEFVTDHGYRSIVAMEEQSLIALDDPVHRERRMRVQPHFSHASVAALRPWIAQLVASLLDRVEHEGSCDVVRDLAAPLSSTITCKVIGFPPSFAEQVTEWSERLMRMDMRDRDGRVYEHFHDAANAIARAVRPLAMERVGCPMGDLISAWVGALGEANGFTTEAFVHELLLFISGGAETTRTAVAHGMRAFVDHPASWDALAVGDESQVADAVEEVLRWVSPLNNMFRRAAVTTTLAGVEIRKGDRLVLLYPSANRDADVFDRPFEFDITRRANPHVAFGFGSHLCLGANLARATLAEFFGQASRRWRDPRVHGELMVEENIFARAVTSFGVKWAPRCN